MSMKTNTPFTIAWALSRILCLVVFRYSHKVLALTFADRSTEPCVIGVCENDSRARSTWNKRTWYEVLIFINCNEKSHCGTVLTLVTPASIRCHAITGPMKYHVLKWEVINQCTCKLWCCIGLSMVMRVVAVKPHIYTPYIHVISGLWLTCIFCHGCVDIGDEWL